MDKNSLKSRDLCTIIEACSKNGVSELKFGDFEIKFNSHRNADVPHETFSPQENVEPTQGQKQPDEMSTFDKELLQSDIISQLMIDDPLAYEKVLMGGSIEQARVLNESSQN